MGKAKVLKDIIMRKGSKGSFRPQTKFEGLKDKAKKTIDSGVKTVKDNAGTLSGLGAVGAGSGTAAYLMREKKAAKEPSWFEKQKGVARASTDGGKKGKGSSYIGLVNKDLIKERLKGSAKGAGKGALIGGAGGAALGLLKGMKGRKGKAGLVAGAIGGLGGALVGSEVGAYKGNKKYLKGKGITSNWGGFSNKFSPEAKKKYIDDYKEKNAMDLGMKGNFMGLGKGKEKSKKKEVEKKASVIGLSKLGGDTGAGVGAAIAGPIGAAIGADKGKRMRSAGGALLGSIPGTAAALYGLKKGKLGLFRGGQAASIGGGAIGASVAHGKNKKK